MAWVPFHEALRTGDKRGIPRAVRFIFLELSLLARSANGVIRLPLGMSDADALHDILGGNRQEIEEAIRWLTRAAASDEEGDEPEPMIRLDGPDGARRLVIPSWGRWCKSPEPSGASTERARRHRAAAKAARDERNGDATAMQRTATVHATTQQRAATALREEKRREEKNPPSGGSRAGAREAPPQGTVGKPEDLTEEGRTVLELMRSLPSLRSAATVDLARRVADHSRSGPHTGRLGLDDVLHAVQRAADLEADSSAAGGVPRAQGELGKLVMGCVRREQLGEARKAAEQEAARDERAVAECLRAFGAAWSKAKGGRPRPPAAGDEDHATKLVVLAEAGAKRSGTTREIVLAHWFKAHLASQDRFIVDADHPLRLLPGRTDSYGLPKPPPAAPKPARPPEPEPDPAPMPPDFLANLDAIGRAGVLIPRRVGNA